MKPLVVFVLAVLGCSRTEGRLVSRCELRDQLNSAIANLTVSPKPNGLSVENVVLKLVCQVEQTTGFNTSAVTQLPGNEGSHTGQQTEDHSKSSEEDHSDSEERKGPSKSKRSRRHDKTPLRPSQPPPAQNCTLYGVFQLNSCQVCNDSVTPSANICGTDCSNFLDDDIHDDISCLLKIPFSPGNFEIAEKKCKNVKTSVYFAQCPSP
ncbi:hypothetical protein Q5P01_025704 [Channa striata]|uniref:Glycosyl hydrolases family 22 (GH22) domain-containing protein n=1 Tax=Channa striata TaxID=64152 RepID=A0AA88LP80_CHASR|nr:hypothetical protein Q5P01_025704 [Channa striata]